MTADQQGRPDQRGQGASEIGQTGGSTGSDSSLPAPTTQANSEGTNGGWIQIPPDAWEAAEREQQHPLRTARAGLPLLGPHRVSDSSSCITIGRALHSTSPTLLPDWQAWAAANPEFTPERCEQLWAGFGKETRKGPTLGTLIFLVREDTGDASFGKRGGA